MKQKKKLMLADVRLDKINFFSNLPENYRRSDLSIGNKHTHKHTHTNKRAHARTVFAILGSFQSY
jgi:hypothetical protein